MNITAKILLWGAIIGLFFSPCVMAGEITSGGEGGGCGNGNCGGESDTGTSAIGIGVGGDATAYGGEGGQGGDAIAIGTGGEGGNAYSDSTSDSSSDSRAAANANAIINQITKVTNNYGSNPSNGGSVTVTDTFTLAPKHGMLVESGSGKCNFVYVRPIAIVPDRIPGTVAVGLANYGTSPADLSHWTIGDTKGNVLFRIPLGVKLAAASSEYSIYVARNISINTQDGTLLQGYDREDVSSQGPVFQQYTRGDAEQMQIDGTWGLAPGLTLEKLLSMEKFTLDRSVPWAVDFGPQI